MGCGDSLGCGGHCGGVGFWPLGRVLEGPLGRAVRLLGGRASGRSNSGPLNRVHGGQRRRSATTWWRVTWRRVAVLIQSTVLHCGQRVVRLNPKLSLHKQTTTQNADIIFEIHATPGPAEARERYSELCLLAPCRWDRCLYKSEA